MDLTAPPHDLVVIDTNIWLDLYAFADPSVERLGEALATVTCLATATMRAELASVLIRPQFRLDEAAQTAILARFDDRVQLAADAPDCRLACSDPADRMFLDLAVGAGARWLISRDKALLKARRHAWRRHGLRIGKPADFYLWLDETAPAPGSGDEAPA